MIVRELLAKFGFMIDAGPLDKVDTRIVKTTKSTDDLQGAFASAAAALAAFGVSRVALDAVDKSLQFGKEMGKVQSLIPGNTARTLEFRDATKALAVQYGKTTSDISAGLYDVISTFGDTADAIDQTTIAVKVGAAGAATTKDGLALLGAVTKAYGDTSATAMQKVADLGFQTVNLGKVELPELAASIGKVTPLAKALGLSQEELFGSMATLTGVTGDGAEVATQMASALRALADRTPDAQKAFKKAFSAEGIKTAQQAIGKYGLQGVLAKLVATTDGTVEGIQKLFGRAEAMQFALALTGAQAGDFKDKLQAMTGAAGATDTAFAAMTGGLAKNAFEHEQTKAKAEQLRIELGDELAPVLGRIELQALSIAQTVGLALIPSLHDLGGAGTDAADQLSGLDLLARGISAVFIGVGTAIDVVVTQIRVLGVALGAVAADVAGMAHMDMSGVAEVGRQARADIAALESGMVGRTKRSGLAIVDPAAARQIDAFNAQAERAKAEAEGARASRRQQVGAAWRGVGDSFQKGGLSGLIANVGAVNVQVKVGEGTTAEQAAHVATEGAKQMWAQMLRQAQRAVPNPQAVPQ